MHASQFSILPSLPRYSKQGMIEEANALGYTATSALLDDWIKKGLVGPANKQGLGRGQGSVAWWSPAQFGLFIECLRARQKHHARIGQMCALPVWKWLYWGRLGDVDLPQVQRAMTTWIDSVHKTTPENARKDARNMVRKIQTGRSEGVLSLIQEVTDLCINKKQGDSDVLRHILEPVITRWFGETDQKQERLMDIELLAFGIPLRQWALQEYEKQIASQPPAFWEWARVFLLYMHLQGQKLQPRMAMSPRYANRYHRLTIYDVIWGACYDLLTTLSLYFVAPDGALQFPKPRPWLQPKNWLNDEVELFKLTLPYPSQLMLPDRMPLIYLRNDVYLTYKDQTITFRLDMPFI